MKKLIIAAVLAAATMFGFAAPVLADSPGQLANGANLFKVYNVTKNGDYASNVAATCNETVKYSIELSNTQYGALSNVTVKANLASGAMSVSATNAANETVTSNGTATVSLDKGSLSYVAGSTVVRDLNGNVLKNVADGIVAGGVNVGALAGSTREFVQFQAKVDCPTTPVVSNINVCDLNTKKTVTIKESDFDTSKYSKDFSKCASTPAATLPAALPSTGPTSVLATMLGLSAIAAGVTYFVQRRRNILG